MGITEIIFIIVMILLILSIFADSFAWAGRATLVLIAAALCILGYWAIGHK